MSDGVVPDVAELVALRAAVSGRRTARRGSQGGGQALSPVRGRGMEYAESREYAAGDDARHIDWRVTARTGRPHTKLYQAERDRLSLIVADTSASMYFGTRVRFKSVQAARAGAIAAWATVRDGDRVAVLRGSSTEAPVSPAGGARGALRVIDALVRWYVAPPLDDGGLAMALDQAQRVLRPGSRLIVLADPGSVATLAASRWSSLARHQEVFLLLLTDPMELSPPAALLPFRTDGSRVEVDLTAVAQRQRWKAEFAAPVQAALQSLPPRGIRVQTLSSEAASESWLSMLGRQPSLVA